MTRPSQDKPQLEAVPGSCPLIPLLVGIDKPMFGDTIGLHTDMAPNFPVPSPLGQLILTDGLATTRSSTSPWKRKRPVGLSCL